MFDLTSSQRAEFTVLAGRSKLEERREDLDSQDLFTGRNASAIAIGTWRLTKSRGILTARALSAFNQFSNDTTDAVSLDKGHDKQAAARVDASISVARRLQADAGAQAEWTDETRFRQRFSSALGRYRTINDFHGQGTRSGALRPAAIDCRASDACSRRARRSLDAHWRDDRLAVAAGRVEAFERRRRSAAAPAYTASSRSSNR